MIHILDDSKIDVIMEHLSQIKKTGIASFQTALLDSTPTKEIVRGQLFNYAVAIYGYYSEEEKLTGIIYYQLPSVTSKQSSADIYWISCGSLTSNQLRELIEKSTCDLFSNHNIGKVSISLDGMSYFAASAISELEQIGFEREAIVKNGVGKGNDLLIYAITPNGHEN